MTMCFNHSLQCPCNLLCQQLYPKFSIGVSIVFLQLKNLRKRLQVQAGGSLQTSLLQHFGSMGVIHVPRQGSARGSNLCLQCMNPMGWALCQQRLLPVWEEERGIRGSHHGLFKLNLKEREEWDDCITYCLHDQPHGWYQKCWGSNLC